jgi:hypothetical protein
LIADGRATRMRDRNFWKENAMRCGHSWILSVSVDECLQAFEITRSELPGAKIQKLERRLCNSLTQRTEIVQVVTTMKMSADLKSIAPRYHLLPMRIAS